MKNQTTIALLLEGDFQSLRDRVQSVVGFFERSSFLDFINTLQKQLNLHRFMSPSELINALAILENIEMNTVGYHHVREMLDKQRYRTLPDIVPNPPVTASRLKCPFASNFASLLTRLHSNLLSQLELSLIHVNNELHVRTVNYTNTMLSQSQAFNDLKNTSKARHLPDKSTSVKDFARRSVTLYGSVIHPSTTNNDKDPGIIDAIEGFAKSSIHHEGTKANKIYQFGGQFLEAIMLNEFSNTTAFKQTGQQGIKPSLVKGHIDWRKDKGGIVAQVSLNVLTLSHCDPHNTEAMQQFFAIGSDGVSLLEIREDELESVNARCIDELRGKTEKQVVPICTLSAQLQMPIDVVTGQHYLQVSAFTVQLNTFELCSTRDLDNALKLSATL